MSSTLDLTLGALEVGTFLSVFLYGIITVQVYIYTQAGFKDRLPVRLLVASMWVLDTMHTIFACIFVYHLTVSQYGQKSSLNEIHWSYIGVLFLNGVMAVAVQSFFAYRLRVISGRLIISLLLGLTCLTRLGMSLTIAVLSNRAWFFTTFLARYEWTIPTALSIFACGDLLNTSTLCFFLSARRTSHASTDKILNDLMIWAIETGLVTTISAIVVLALSVAIPGSLTWVGLYFFFPKFYSISMLTSLNNRQQFRRLDDCDTNERASAVHFASQVREVILDISPEKSGQEECVRENVRRSILSM